MSIDNISSACSSPGDWQDCASFVPEPTFKQRKRLYGCGFVVNGRVYANAENAFKRFCLVQYGYGQYAKNRRKIKGGLPRSEWCGKKIIFEPEKPDTPLELPPERVEALAQRVRQQEEKKAKQAARQAKREQAEKEKAERRELREARRAENAQKEKERARKREERAQKQLQIAADKYAAAERHQEMIQRKIDKTNEELRRLQERLNASKQQTKPRIDCDGIVHGLKIDLSLCSPTC